MIIQSYDYSLFSKNTIFTMIKIMIIHLLFQGTHARSIHHKLTVKNYNSTTSTTLYYFPANRSFLSWIEFEKAAVTSGASNSVIILSYNRFWSVIFSLAKKTSSISWVCSSSSTHIRPHVIKKLQTYRAEKYTNVVLHFSKFSNF